MFRPQLTADGLAVRLPIADRAAPLLDELSLAYAEDPAVIGALLFTHADSVRALDHAVVCAEVADHERALRAAQADGTRDALLAEVVAAGNLDAELSPREAIRLADDLTVTAARILARKGSRPA
ncbi:hypothetical protein [Streptomyces sp. NPDC003077]|uniref:hypothetical protein n=1 Tax=Streptomyces sp. NPDC003077 TaxID=3154443 RepID=UPI0033B1C06A